MFLRACVGAVLMTTALFAADDAPTPAAFTPPQQPQVDFRARALTRELQRMYTIRAEELVATLDAAARRDPSSPSLSLLLAIAHTETSGDVLDISEAGAVGLAQATPVALRQEGIEGKLYVTRDYLDGARAYILKKPLHDVEVIADDVLEGGSIEDAKLLLASAMSLRHEGVEELDLLVEWADEGFFADIRCDEARNLALLQELQKALDANDRKALRRLHDRARYEYRASIARQQSLWRRYQQDLVARRDAFLERQFSMRASTARRKFGYVAGEILATDLDVRFSPSKMADFLIRHVSRKAVQAGSLAAAPKLEEMTAALYNGGTHNVKRMLAGLITWLPETENYMQKVPAIRRRLDRAVLAAVPLVADDRDDSLVTPFR
jgi:hypothetical protein